MSQDSMDRDLHDYLDGRLDEKARQAFETRMASDPDLARRAAFYRDVGRVLREAPASAPPGFLDRARVRFEASGSPPRPTRRRVFSWKAAGLAAAALLVAALLIPRNRQGPEAPGVPVSTAPEQSRNVPVEAPVRKPSPALVGREQILEVDDRAGRADRVKDEEEEARAAPPQGRVPGAATAKAMSAVVENERSADSAAASKMAAATAPSPRCEALPETAGLAPGSLLVISRSDQESWRELLVGPARVSLDRLRPDFRIERVVLLGGGPTPPSCDAIRVLHDEGIVRIVLRPRAGQGLSGGLALVIPAGASRVLVETASDVPR